jgi:hypothetical protein
VSEVVAAVSAFDAHMSTLITNPAEKRTYNYVYRQHTMLRLCEERQYVTLAFVFCRRKNQFLDSFAGPAGR